MFSFAYPGILLLLVLVPLFVVLYAWARHIRQRNIKRFGRPDVIKELMPLASQYKAPLKITVQMLALACIILALARPWGGVKDEKTTKEGIEVVIAVDASNSMLAPATESQDGPSRMRTAKLMLERLVGRLHNDRVGLIVYTADAYSLIPVTSDYVSAKVFLNSIDPSQYTNQGTNIAAAIQMAVESFKQDKRTGKAIILLTDAEDLEDEQSVMSAAKDAAKHDIQIDVVGVGGSTPVKIPMNGTFMTDPATGAPVETALNEDLAARIAATGKGIYVNAGNADALNELTKQLDTIKKTALESSLSAVHDELFWIFAIAAMIFIVADIMLLNRKIGWLDKVNFFKRDTSD